MTTAHSCPHCGSEVAIPTFEDTTHAALLDAQQQIADLQAQVRLLNQKAAAAVDRWSDYEEELAQLRTALRASKQLQEEQARTTPSPPAVAQRPATASSRTTPPLPPQGLLPAALPTPRKSSFLGGGKQRVSSLLTSRKSTPSLKPTWQTHANLNGALSSSAGTPVGAGAGGSFSPAMPLSPTPSTDDLIHALTYEQSLRLEAEGKLNDTSREVEELSVQLFEQANEMVATERRARAKLEERVELLERRDHDKHRRLERLESAMGRIERVRELLGNGDRGSAAALTAPSTPGLTSPTMSRFQSLSPASVSAKAT